jgi:hypothetical protein
MQLYSEEKDWSKLVEVVLKLAGDGRRPKQKAKYLHTAAIVAAPPAGRSRARRQLLRRGARARSDPRQGACKEAIELRIEKADGGVERLSRCSSSGARDERHAKMLATFEALGASLQGQARLDGRGDRRLRGRADARPRQRERNELLAEMYASDPAEYLDKAVAAQRHPAPQPVQARRVQAAPQAVHRAKRADAAWCLCQALFCMNLAEPDEERFFKRMRSETAAAAQDRLGRRGLAEQLMHEDADPLVTAIFALIEPAVLRKNGQPLEALGYQMAYALDLSRTPTRCRRRSTTRRACSAWSPRSPSRTRTIRAASRSSTPTNRHRPRPAALAAEMPRRSRGVHRGAPPHVLPPRPVPPAPRAHGHGPPRVAVRGHQARGAEFPVAASSRAPVAENQKSIERSSWARPAISCRARSPSCSAGRHRPEEVGRRASTSRPIARASSSPNDLELAHEMIKAGDEAAAAVPQKERLKELSLYSVSEQYFAIRERLGITIDS